MPIAAAVTMEVRDRADQVQNHTALQTLVEGAQDLMLIGVPDRETK